MSETENHPRRGPSFKEILNAIGSLPPGGLEGLAAALASKDGFEATSERSHRLASELGIEAGQISLMLQALRIVNDRLPSSDPETAVDMSALIDSLAGFLDRTDVVLKREAIDNVRRLLLANQDLEKRRLRDAARQGYGDEALTFSSMVELRPTSLVNLDGSLEFVVVSQIQMTLRTLNPDTSNLTIQLDSDAVEKLQECLEDIRVQMASLTGAKNISVVR